MVKKEKPETSVITTCQKCHEIVEIDVTGLVKTVTDAIQSRDKDLAKEIKECLTNGWSDHEKSHWNDYLEEEIKPYWAILYDFLKRFG